MGNRTSSFGVVGKVTALAVFALSMLAAAQQGQERVLHSFNGSDGYTPEGGLVMDASGNLYGTTSAYGTYQAGTAFELSPGSGAWKEKVLHNFGSGTDGAYPYSGLAVDSSGNLYGTTLQGGTNSSGTVFELMPNADGAWSEKVLHDFDLFSEGGDGAYPYGGLILDASGNLYGTLSAGAGHGEGAVFELTPNRDGSWTEILLYSFMQNGVDGNYPTGSLTFDRQGRLYGTTLLGGTYYNCYGNEYGCGTVFELAPQAGGAWTETVLHDFDNNGSDGNEPRSNLTFDAAGNLYGTDAWGGSQPNCFGNGFGCGTVFELSPTVDGDWIEKTVHEFGSGQDGSAPASNLIFDKAGNLYGTTAYGGAFGSGIAFELVRSGDEWTERILHNFFQKSTDGTVPVAGPVLDSAGNIYGTTSFGGSNGGTRVGGTVYEIKP
jgi:uncharacterized repeat protein (TIGR03803 family)